MTTIRQSRFIIQHLRMATFKVAGLQHDSFLRGRKMDDSDFAVKGRRSVGGCEGVSDECADKQCQLLLIIGTVVRLGDKFCPSEACSHLVRSFAKLKVHFASSQTRQCFAKLAYLLRSPGMLLQS